MSLPYMEYEENQGNQEVLLHSYKSGCRLEMFGWEHRAGLGG